RLPLVHCRSLPRLEAGCETGRSSGPDRHAMRNSGVCALLVVSTALCLALVGAAQADVGLTLTTLNVRSGASSAETEAGRACRSTSYRRAARRTHFLVTAAAMAHRTPGIRPASRTSCSAIYGARAP